MKIIKNRKTFSLVLPKMDFQYFDIHSHLNFKDYSSDFEAVLDNLKETKTGTITIGTDIETSRQAVEIAGKNENIWASIGVHPVDKPERENFDISQFEELVKHPKVVAIGECGLDFFHIDKAGDFERQKKLFLDQVEFAIKYDKPLMIHVRDAYAELLDILEPMKREHGEKLRGNIHFFAGDISTAKRFLDLGFTLSFTGVITFTHDYDEVIKFAPLSSIMSETDAPFVAPVPHRGKRNEPSYVRFVAEKIAEIRGEEPGKVEHALVSNAHRFFLGKEL